MNFEIKQFTKPFPGNEFLDGYWLVVVDGGNDYLHIDRVIRHSAVVDRPGFPTQYTGYFESKEAAELAVMDYKARKMFNKIRREFYDQTI